MGMSQTGCCCSTVKHGTCVSCFPEVFICCIQVEHSAWSANAPILLKYKDTGFPDPTACPEDTNATEICGYLVSHWATTWAKPDDYCLPSINLRWKPIDSDCDRIEMTLSITVYDEVGVGTTAQTVIETNRSWTTRDTIFDDPFDSSEQIRIRLCPEGYTAYPEDEEKPVVLEAVMQQKVMQATVYVPPEVHGGIGYWETEWTGEWADVPTIPVLFGTPSWYPFGEERDGGVLFPAPQVAWSRTTGNCACSKRWCPYDFFWAVDLYANTVGFKKVSRTVRLAQGGYQTVDFWGSEIYGGCDWYEGEIFIYANNDPESSYRLRVQPVGEYNCDNGTDPTPPPLSCKRERLCVIVTTSIEPLVKEEFTLVWNSGEQRYHLNPIAVDSNYSIEIILEEDPDNAALDTAAPGMRAFVLTVYIRHLPDDTLVLTVSEVFVIDCTKEWSRSLPLEIPALSPDVWRLFIGTRCSAYTPPACDPGCWPECVMCPTRKTLAIAITDNPSCCLGTYSLTYDEEGDIYELLGVPVGGPPETCGQIVSAAVSCLSATSIKLDIQFKDWDGVLKTADSFTLDVMCDEAGNMESEAVSIGGTFSNPCGEFVWDAGLLRVVSI